MRAMRQARRKPKSGIAIPPVCGPAQSQAQFDMIVRQSVGFLVEALQGKDPVDALICATDRDAIYVAAAVKLLGLTPGRDVIVTGYDNYWSRCEETNFTTARPDITADKHNEVAGRSMLELLLRRIKAVSTPGVFVCRNKPELVITS